MALGLYLFFSEERIVCIMDSDVNEFSVAWHSRLAYDRPTIAKLKISDEEITKLKELCDSRNNAGITEFFKSKENAADLFHFAVLQLTCNDDPESLEEVLDFGQNQTPKLEFQWKEEKDVLSTEDPCLSRNPIMIASQQVAFKHLHSLVKTDFFRAFMNALGFFTNVATGSPKLNGRLQRSKMKRRR